MPTAALPSKVVAISHPEISPDEIARRFRRADPPVIGRIEADRFLLDLRGVFDPASLVPRHSP
jgi:L-seryl-tRNA(Ser) seleniumtransferase